MHPLKQYKIDSKKEWKQIAKECDIAVQTLYDIITYDPETTGSITVRTAEKIRKATGINLWKYYKNNKK